MTEIAPTRRPRLTDVPSPSTDDARPGSGFVWRFWLVVAAWVGIVAERSAALGIPVRDPEGQMFTNRLVKALVLLVAIALVEAVVRSRARGWSARNVMRVLRERWTGSRLLLVVTGLIGYHLVYLGYRNLKSWNAFNPLRDDDLLAWDRALFLGHSPWVMLHTLLGESYAAEALAAVYRSFTYVIVLALVGSLALIPRVQKAYVFLSAADLGLDPRHAVLLRACRASAPTPPRTASSPACGTRRSPTPRPSTSPSALPSLPTPARPTRSSASAPSPAFMSGSPRWCS